MLNENETAIPFTEEAASQPHVQDDAAPRVEQAHRADEGSGRTLGPFLVDDKCRVVSTSSRMWLFSTINDYENARSLIEMALKVPPPASETGQASAWQPISSAPKDGTYILLYADDYCQVGWSHGDYWGPVDDQGTSMIPTHWMPLPLAPSEDETARTER